ncbi:unnamed protein product, partial [marine sediment metagenome]
GESTKTGKEAMHLLEKTRVHNKDLTLGICVTNQDIIITK